MQRENLSDLNAFVVVAEERSFTRAAAKLGTSQSALSHTIRRLEDRLGVRLLTRTTRSVVPTIAGDRLLQTLGPAFDTIDAGITALGDLRDKPAGLIRITTTEHAATTILWPVLKKLLPDYPDLQIELSLDASLTDIVAERFDAGVRFGEALAKDMVAVRIGPDVQMLVVGAPQYFARYGRPRGPDDLADHRCINMRLPTLGGLYPWELEKDGRLLRVRVDGQLVFNSLPMIIEAAVAGLGLGFVMADQITDHLAAGRLEAVLEDWCPPFPGYYLYYPSRRQPSAAFSLLVDHLRYRD